MKKLNQLIDEIQNSSIDLILEVLNINNHYHFERERNNLWSFLDKIGTKHFIILHKDLSSKIQNDMELKFGWYDGENPRYDRPNSYDDKIFNTHLFIFFHEILNQFKEYKLIYNFKPTDIYRYRLYRMAINKYLDKAEYELIENEKILTVKII